MPEIAEEKATPTIDESLRLNLALPQNTQLINDAWDKAQPLIMACQETWDDLYTLAYFEQAVKSGQIQLWLLEDIKKTEVIGVILARFVPYPKRYVLDLLLCCGEQWEVFLRQSLMGLQVVEALARQYGIDMSIVHGRLGWKKCADKLGYKMTSATYTRKLIPQTLH